MKIGVTGHLGLVGSGLVPALRARGWDVEGLDLRAGDDVRTDVSRLAGCDGVVHLAAVSRVVWAERDPEGAIATNVGGTERVCAQARTRGQWVLFASSREVYGQPSSLPVREDAPLAPMNTYARTKVEGERLAASVPRHAIVRLSNVYGAVDDHPDRVIPAFARAAVEDRELVVEGAGHVFDFVHRDDAVRGLVAVIERLTAGIDLPPVHLVTGVGTTLGAAAELAIALGGGGWMRAGTPRSYDVSGFWGDPSRSADVLGWSATVPLRSGLARLIAELR